MTYKELCKKSFELCMEKIIIKNNKNLHFIFQCIKKNLYDLGYEIFEWLVAFVYITLFPISSLILYRLHLRNEKKFNNRKKRQIRKIFPNIKQKELEPDRF